MARRSTDFRKSAFELTWYGDDFLALIDQYAEEGLFAAGEILLANARGRAPRRAGGLANSGYVATNKRSTYAKRARNFRKEIPVGREKTVLVAFAAFYANFLEDTGAKPHRVPYPALTKRAKTRKGIYIPGIGFRKSAQHPGFRRRPFLGPALDATQATLAEKLVKVLREQAQAKLGV